MENEMRSYLMELNREKEKEKEKDNRFEKTMNLPRSIKKQ